MPSFAHWVSEDDAHGETLCFVTRKGSEKVLQERESPFIAEARAAVLCWVPDVGARSRPFDAVMHCVFSVSEADD